MGEELEEQLAYEPTVLNRGVSLHYVGPLARHLHGSLLLEYLVQGRSPARFFPHHQFGISFFCLDH